MHVAHMPTAQVEVGKQEYDQSRSDARLDASAPNSLGRVLQAEHFPPEAKVDADIGEHRPRERCRGGKDHRAANDEHDGQEQGEKTRYANQNALVEGQAGRLVLEGVRLPQIELRQRRRAQLRNIGDGGSRIESQAEYVRARVVVPFRRRSLTGRDCRDSRGAEIGPYDAGADKAKMRRDNKTGQLLVGIVGQREDDPRRLSSGFERAHFDSPHDAIRAGRGRDLNPVALGAVIVQRPE